MTITSSMNRAKLIVTRGSHKESFDLKGSHIYIGRGKDNDIAIEKDSFLSRRHALIARLADDYFLCDLGSSNGTLLNGKPFKGIIPLRAGDEIFVGMTKILFNPEPAESLIRSLATPYRDLPIAINKAAFSAV